MHREREAKHRNWRFAHHIAFSGVGRLVYLLHVLFWIITGAYHATCGWIGSVGRRTVRAESVGGHLLVRIQYPRVEWEINAKIGARRARLAFWHIWMVWNGTQHMGRHWVELDGKEKRGHNECHD